MGRAEGRSAKLGARLRLCHHMAAKAEVLCRQHVVFDLGCKRAAKHAAETKPCPILPPVKRGDISRPTSTSIPSEKQKWSRRDSISQQQQAPLFGGNGRDATNRCWEHITTARCRASVRSPTSSCKAGAWASPVHIRWGSHHFPELTESGARLDHRKPEREGPSARFRPRH